jgi:hypothetical protein
VTDVTIRGIDSETYAQFAAEAKKRGVAIGELTTEAMQSLLASAGAPVYTIGNLDMLTVSRNDLESVEGTIVLSNIDLLEFADDVDWPIFNQRIKTISNVDLLRIPRSLSKFQVLTKSKNVELIQMT